MNIKALRDLCKDHLAPLQHMHHSAQIIARSLKASMRGNPSNILLGYHAVPSLEPLHLHIISDDFDSDYMRTKKHWNSYVSPFFVSTREVEDELRAKGSVNFEDRIEHLSQPIGCTACRQELKTMKDLKAHRAKCNA